MIEAGSLADHAPNRVGHKGLFFQRLDAPAQGPHLVGGAVGVYHCRNRELRPDLQRWMQQDPNGTGQVVLDVAAMHGGTLFPSAALPSAGAMFTDGLHLAAYLGSSPVLRADELGLFSERGARAHGLAPGWYGPGWSSGGVFYHSGTASRASQAAAATQSARGWAARAYRGASAGAGRGLAQEALYLAARAGGAGLAHVLFGQDSSAGGGVLCATVRGLASRAWNNLPGTVGMSAIGGLSYGGAAFEAGYYAANGDYGSSLRALTVNTMTYLRDNIPASQFCSMIFPLAGAAIVAGGLYSGMVEYMINDGYNWGFGVKAGDLGQLWSRWE